MDSKTGIGQYRVDVAFCVEASSPAMAARKLLNAIHATLGEDYMEALHRSMGIDPEDNRKEIPVDTSIALDDPRLIAGAYIGVSHIDKSDDGNAFNGVAQF